MSIQGPSDFTPEQTKLILMRMIEDFFGPTSSQEKLSLATHLFVPNKETLQTRFTHTARLLAELMVEKEEGIALLKTDVQNSPCAEPQKDRFPLKEGEPQPIKPSLSLQQVRLALEVLSSLFPQQSDSGKAYIEKLRLLVQELIQAVGRKETDSSNGKRYVPVFHPEPEGKSKLKTSVPFPFKKEKETPAETKLTEKHSVTQRQNEEQSLKYDQKKEQRSFLRQEMTFHEERLKNKSELLQYQKKPFSASLCSESKNETPQTPKGKETPFFPTQEKGAPPSSILNSPSLPSAVISNEQPRSKEPILSDLDPIVTVGPFTFSSLTPLKSPKKKKRLEDQDEAEREKEQETN